MGKLDTKSEFNVTAADLLIDNSLYGPSVHCSYFACIQQSMDKVIEFFKFTPEQIEHAVRADPQTGRHNFIINFIESELSSKRHEQEAREYARGIKQLKRLRVEADYNLEIIDSAKALQAQQYRNAVLRLIRTTLK